MKIEMGRLEGGAPINNNKCEGLESARRWSRPRGWSWQEAAVEKGL